MTATTTVTTIPENARDALAHAYAHYGIEFIGNYPPPEQEPPALETLLLTVLEETPPGRFISTLPAMIIKNAEQINFRTLALRANQSPELSAKLGYILDITLACIRRTRTKKAYDKKAIRTRINAVIPSLQPSNHPILCMSQEIVPFYHPIRLIPKDFYERKWGVITKNSLESYQKHTWEYVR